MENSPGPSWKVLGIGLLVLAVLSAFYLMSAKRFEWWPYGTVSLDWDMVEEYKSQDYGFTIVYPDSWHSEECRDSGPGGTYLLVSFGDAEDLVICNSDAPIQGIVNINAAPSDGVGVNIDQEIASTMANLDNAQKTSTTVDGQPATRIEGTTRKLEGPSAPAGLKLILIYASKDGNTYRIFYLNDTSKIDQFEHIVKSFKFGVRTDLKTYKNIQYGFEITYPTTFSEGIKTGSYIPPCDQGGIVCLSFTSNAYSNTNFESSGISVRTDSGRTTADACRQPSSNSNEKTAGARTINDIQFAQFTDGNAATGHYANDTIYRNFHAGKCFEIRQRIAESQFQNYPTGTISEFTEQDREQLQKILDQVFSTFKFTQ